MKPNPSSGINKPTTTTTHHAGGIKVWIIETPMIFAVLVVLSVLSVVGAYMCPWYHIEYSDDNMGLTTSLLFSWVKIDNTTVQNEQMQSVRVSYEGLNSNLQQVFTISFFLICTGGMIIVGGLLVVIVWFAIAMSKQKALTTTKNSIFSYVVSVAVGLSFVLNATAIFQFLRLPGIMRNTVALSSIKNLFACSAGNLICSNFMGYDQQLAYSVTWGPTVGFVYAVAALLFSFSSFLVSIGLSSFFSQYTTLQPFSKQKKKSKTLHNNKSHHHQYTSLYTFLPSKM